MVSVSSDSFMAQVEGRTDVQPCSKMSKHVLPQISHSGEIWFIFTYVSPACTITSVNGKLSDLSVQARAQARAWALISGTSGGTPHAEYLSHPSLIPGSEPSESGGGADTRIPSYQGLCDVSSMSCRNIVVYHPLSSKGLRPK